MPTRDLLPGVKTRSCPPPVVCDAHAAIRKARRRAMLREAMQLVLLAGVDYLFLRWPESRLPFLDRAGSLQLLGGTNVVILGHVLLSRAVPRWYAQHVATTWCREERERFRATVPSRSASSSRTSGA